MILMLAASIWILVSLLLFRVWWKSRLRMDLAVAVMNLACAVIHLVLGLGQVL